MRVFDILKKGKGVPGKRRVPEEKPPPPEKERRETLPEERVLERIPEERQEKIPEERPEIRREEPERVVSGGLKENSERVYRELVLFMENFWNRLEKGKPLDLDTLRSLSKNIVDCFIEDSQIVCKMNSLYDSENYLPYHSVNVCLLSLCLGQAVGYPQERLNDLALAALLHDIGMSRVDKSVFLRSEKLSPGDWQDIKRHPLHTKEILKSMEGISEEILKGACHVHERQNGEGYPYGYKNGEIHEFAQILGLSDTYEALTHSRLHREAKTPYKAIKEILEKNGRYFDQSLLKHIVEIVTFYPVGYFVQLNTGEIAQVIKTFPDFPTRPVVKIVQDKDGKKLAQPKVIDLSRQAFFFVQKMLNKEEEKKLIS